MAFKGCVAYKSADLLTQNVTTATAITFNTDLYDTDSWHDTVSNTSRMTVPSGVTRVQLSARARIDLLTANEAFTAEIRKNGSSMTPAIIGRNTFSTVNPSVNLLSPPLDVTPGDYFELFISVPTDTSVTVRQYCWLAIWEYPDPPPTFAGALVRKAADQTAANYTTLSVIAFDSETYDVSGWHDNVTNNSRLTAPGTAYVLPMAQINLGSLTAGDWAFGQISMNGASMVPAVTHAVSCGAASTAPSFLIVGYPVAMVATDYLQASLQVLSDTSITVTDDTWFSAMELD